MIPPKLTLTEKNKAAVFASPEAKLPGKMLEASSLQMEEAKAMLKGETFIREVVRSS